MNTLSYFRFGASFLLAAALTVPAAAQTTARVSTGPLGAQANAFCYNAALSNGARFIAFDSPASSLVIGDLNATADVFVHDRFTGETTLVSVSSLGTAGNGSSSAASISANGRYVAFHSFASNLVVGDNNGFADVFVHDRLTGTTTRVSLDSLGVEGNFPSLWPSISADGSCVAFISSADNLVVNDLNAQEDVFVHDRTTGVTTRVSVDSLGVEADAWSSFPAISADSNVVAFHTAATNLVPNDLNGNDDVFLHDRTSGITSRVSVDSLGTEGNGPSQQPALSADGTFVTFSSGASNLVPSDTNNADDVFVRDRNTGTTTRVSVSSSGQQGVFYSNEPGVSPSGRYVSFTSLASNLVGGDTNGTIDVFVHDRQLGRTVRASVDNDRMQGTGWSRLGALSPDGHFVAFESNSPNLAPGDTNGTFDVFVRGLDAQLAHMAIAGACPGAIDVTIWNATPGNRVLVLNGATGGSYQQTGTPCLGLVLGLGSPTVLRRLNVDAEGRASFTANPPAALCGTSIQAVDTGTCTASSALVL